MNVKAKEYAQYYRKHLLEDVMPFWDVRCIDKECGGYFTCFDRKGNLTDANKYIWFQGRQLYMYALLYNRIERRQDWLDKARHGYEFLVKHAYAGNGRWNYELDRQGNVLVGTNSIYADYHVTQGLGEYMKAIDLSDPEGMKILNDTYYAIERNTQDPKFKDIFENTWSSKFIWHDMYLTALSAADVATGALGEKRTHNFVYHCIDKILNWFARDDYSLVFEAITRDNKVDLDPQGRFINPGHTLESAWFCMKTGKDRFDREIIDRALKIVKWGYDVGWDKEYGGIISYADAIGKEPEPLDWFKETNSMWDDKVWWANCEALCSFAMAWAFSGEQCYLGMFEKLHAYCRDNFFDPEYGEWYERLHRDGSVKVADKGTKWKCAFHLGRSLVMLIDIFEGRI